MTLLLTVEDVAEQTRLSASTVRAAIRAGELRASRLRRQYRVHPDDLAAWIEQERVQPDAPLAPAPTLLPPRGPHGRGPGGGGFRQLARKSKDAA